MKRIKKKYIINAIAITFIGLLIAIAYKETLIWMYGRYTGIDSYYSHGFIIPFISLYFIYDKKNCFERTKEKAWKVGFFVILSALFLHLLGTILYIFFISGVSLFFLLIGLSIYFCGIENTKTIWFPLLFLFFMFPIPMALIELISFPLKMFAAKVGVWLVSQFFIPVYREGFNIFIPAGHLVVGNPCSGLRSLISFLALGSIFAHIMPISAFKKLVLFLLANPIALLSNIARVPILILASHYLGLNAAAPDTIIHTGSGLFVFVLGFVLLLVSAKALEWQTKK